MTSGAALGADGYAHRRGRHRRRRLRAALVTARRRRRAQAPARRDPRRRLRHADRDAARAPARLRPARGRMTAPQLAAYTFLPWVQGGVARSIAAADEPGAALTARVTLPVAVHVDGAGDVPATVRLLRARRRHRARPAPRSCAATRRPAPTRFEAGYMPQVQFARADLPWLFTPAAPGTREDAAAAVAGARHGPPPGRRAPGAESRRAAAGARARAPAPAAELPDLVAVVGVGARADRRARRRRPARRRARLGPRPGLLAAGLPAPPASPTPRTWPASCRRSWPASRPGSASR